MSMQHPHPNPIRAMTKEEILCKLLKKEKGYYEAILDLTEQENHFLTRCTLKELVPLTKKKGILMACVEEIESALRPIKKRWHDEGEHSHPLASEVRERLAELDTIMKKILELDAANQKLFQKELMALRQGQGAVQK